MDRDRDGDRDRNRDRDRDRDRGIKVQIPSRNEYRGINWIVRVMYKYRLQWFTPSTEYPYSILPARMETVKQDRLT